jgi:hypothetical protein
VTVPGVIGFTLDNAKLAIEQVGLVFSTTETDMTKTVASEVPLGGTQVAAGSTVTVTAGVTPPPPVGGPIARADLFDANGNLVQSLSSGGLTPDNLARLQAARDALSEVLGDGIKRDPFLSDKKVAAALQSAMTTQGHGVEAAKVLGDGDAHPMLMRITKRHMQRTAEGQKLLKDYNNGAPAPGWLQNFLNWLIKNGPALMQFIQMIMKMFGLGDVPDLPPDAAPAPVPAKTGVLLPPTKPGGIQWIETRDGLYPIPNVEWTSKL